jgi:hypothetical protein
VMGLCSGSGRVWSWHALWMVWLHTELSLVRAEVMCVVHCVTMACVSWGELEDDGMLKGLDVVCV